MEVGLLRGQGALLMEESLYQRLKALKRHPLRLATVSDYTKTVFKQTPVEDGYLVFENVEDSQFCLMLNRSSDLDFAQLIFPDHIGNLTSDGENQYSFLCIYRSHNFLESKETIFTPKSHLKLLSVRGVRTDSANNALQYIQRGPSAYRRRDDPAKTSRHELGHVYMGLVCEPYRRIQKLVAFVKCQIDPPRGETKRPTRDPPLTVQNRNERVEHIDIRIMHPRKSQLCSSDVR
jgi:hypothetical protein